MTTSLVSPVLVGRQAEFAVLDGALERAIAGEPTAVLVGGEAGVGKSRLVHELSRRADEAGARVLVGGCVESEVRGSRSDRSSRCCARSPPSSESTSSASAWARHGARSPGCSPSSRPASTVRSSDDGASRVPELVLGLVSRLAAERPAGPRLRGRAVGRPLDARPDRTARAGTDRSRAVDLHGALRRAAPGASVSPDGRTVGPAALGGAAGARAARRRGGRRPDPSDPRSAPRRRARRPAVPAV